MEPVTWVLESDVFPATHAALRDAVRNHGLRLIDWSDEWWTAGLPDFGATQAIIFHGSLGNAARIDSELNWQPGSYCPTDAFRCSRWYDSAKEFLIHRRWQILPANEFVEHARQVARELSSPDKVFVRPDSPLKPFSGRVLTVDKVSLATLDHGFYFDDETIPIVVAPTQTIQEEVRFVVVSDRVVTGSGYDAATRRASRAPLTTQAAGFAQEVADAIEAPSPVYVMDVCRTEQGWQLLEFNPFGGADLYASDPEMIVHAVCEAVIQC